ncbi:hypothetical protein [Asticcacaulis taihuensis]|uniref:hypothetical protein n=1 Tax=Asticcacaulis taihuensis TaxID=260084 RepID=UPI0026ECA453|nr:hypothetical protein [Asticcacaulis taihuensis]
MADETEDTPRHPSEARHSVSWWRQGGGLLIAPLAWMTLLLVQFTIADFGCGRFNPFAPWLIALGIASILAGGIGGVVAWSVWRSTRHEAEGGEGEAIEVGEGRSRFFAITGLLSSGIFTTASLFTLLAVLMVPPC